MKKYISDEIAHRDKEGKVVFDKVVRINFGQLVLVFVSSMVAAAGASAWATLRLANTIPFRVEAVEKEIVHLKEADKQSMPLQLSMEKWKANDDKLTRIENKLDQVNERIDSIYKLIK